MKGCFISGVGTNVGKTMVGRGLAHALHRAGHRIAALKPIETGCQPAPRDAIALATACGQPQLANADGFYRAEAPLSPWAIEAIGGPGVPPLPSLVASIHQAAAGAEIVLVEGAGGILVPLNAELDIADLVAALQLPLVLVARDELGVLSFTLSAVEAAQSRQLAFAAIVLTESRSELAAAAVDHGDAEQASFDRGSNCSLLAQRLGPIPVHLFNVCAPDGGPPTDDHLADVAASSGLLQSLASNTSPPTPSLNNAIAPKALSGIPRRSR